MPTLKSTGDDGKLLQGASGEIDPLYTRRMTASLLYLKHIIPQIQCIIPLTGLFCKANSPNISLPASSDSCKSPQPQLAFLPSVVALQIVLSYSNHLATSINAEMCSRPARVSQ